MKTITVNTQDLIKMTSELTKANEEINNLSQRAIREVLDAVVAVVKAQLAQADEDNTVEVKLFNGLTIVSKYREPREARNPKTGETVMTKAGNVVKTKIGQKLKDAANA